MSMKKLGFGMMRLPLTDPDVPSSIDVPRTAEMVDAFLQRGFTYFDTAYGYCDGESERATRKAVVERHPRDSFLLATKLNSCYVKCLEDRDRVFYDQLEKTGAGYFDYYLLHAIGSNYPEYQQFDCFNWLREKKQQGLVRKIGFSFHGTAALLEQILTEHPEMEFVQLQINYLDWESDNVQSRLCYEVATRHGKPVIVMEPVKGGMLANLPAAAEGLLRQAHPDWSPASWALRFVAGLENVFMVLSGMSNMQQVEDNISFMGDVQPLTHEEQALLRRVVEIINGGDAIACTGCAYCVAGCPMNIAIPQYFAAYNTADKASYESLTGTFGKPTDCIGCGQCEDICPQHLPIIEDLKRVTQRFE